MNIHATNIPPNTKPLLDNTLMECHCCMLNFGNNTTLTLVATQSIVVGCQLSWSMRHCKHHFPQMPILQRSSYEMIRWLDDNSRLYILRQLQDPCLVRSINIMWIWISVHTKSDYWKSANWFTNQTAIIIRSCSGRPRDLARTCPPCLCLQRAWTQNAITMNTIILNTYSQSIDNTHMCNSNYLWIRF